VQHGIFVTLSRQDVSPSYIDRGVRASPRTTEFSEERVHGHIGRPCEPHKCSSHDQNCYGPIEASRKRSFMEEISTLTISMFFIVIYLYSIMCIYIDILFYVVL
jgi:hypothetical protein